jgi:hypothetical protein
MSAYKEGRTSIMKRKPIRNKDSERVCDALIDTEKGRILLETKVGRNTMQIEFAEFIQAVTHAAAASDNNHIN